MTIIAFLKNKAIALWNKRKVPSLLDTYLGGLEYVFMLLLVALGLFFFAAGMFVYWAVTFPVYCFFTFHRPNGVCDYLDDL